MAGGGISEGVVEEACLGYFQALGYRTAAGPAIGPDGTAPERSSWDDVLLPGRLRDAIARINPELPAGVVDQAVTRVRRAESQSAMAENERLHQLLVGGVPVEHRVDGAVGRGAVVANDSSWGVPAGSRVPSRRPVTAS